MFIRPERKRHAHLTAGVLLACLPWLAVSAQGAAHLSPADGDNGDLFGRAATELEDLNADGRWEFLIGAPGDQTAGLDAGAVFLWFGGTALTVAPDRTWSGAAPEQFGWAVARIGDVNDDGRPDWAVGAPKSNTAGLSSGRLYVFYGAANPPATASLVIDGEVGGDEFGYSVSAAGDFDGDGVDDFIVGAPYSDKRAQNAGAAYVVYGQAGGPSADLADATVFTGQIAEDHFGAAVTDAGNFLGGTEACVAVGAPLSNTYGGLDAGAVFVFEGKLAGAAPDTAIDFAAGIGANAKAGSSFGFAVRSCGLWSADSYTDLAVGAPLCDESATEAGRVEIFFGGTSPSASASRTVDGTTATDHLGWSLARAYDVSGSSLDDLLIGAPGRDASGAEAGAAYIYEGGQASFSSAASLVAVPVVPLLAGTAAGDEFGGGVACAGDFDGDGGWDYAVGAPGGNNLSGALSGYCYLVDTTDSVVPAFMAAWRSLWAGPDLVRLEFRLAVDPSTVRSLTLVRTVVGEQAGTSVTVWDGAPVVGSAPAAGVLTAGSSGADGLVFLDDVSGTAAFGVPIGAAEVTYALTVAPVTGNPFTLSPLAGPDLDARPLPDSPTRVLALGAAWPNPANPAVTLAFRATAGVTVQGRVMDLRGRLVRALPAVAGTGAWQSVVWDGRDKSGQAAPSGVYFLQLEAAGRTAVQRVVLAR